MAAPPTPSTPAAKSPAGAIAGGAASTKPAAPPPPSAPAPHVLAATPANLTGGRDAHLTARSTRHAAWIAAVAAIVSTLVALGGILWSGATSAEATDRAARTAADAAVQAVLVQMAGENEKSRADFLRSSRQALYTKIVLDEQALLSAAKDREHRIARTRGKKLGRYARKTRGTGGQQDQALSADAAACKLIGTESTCATVDDLIIIHLRLGNTLSSALSYRLERDGEWVNVLNDDFNPLLKTRFKLRERFLQRARNDLGTR